MKQETLTVTKREGKGRGVARRLRAQGKIPAVKSGASNLTVDEREFLLLMRKISGSASLVNLEVDQGESKLSIIQDTQRNPRTDRFEHIDFHEVVRGEQITAHIPVHTKGEAYGVKNESGVLEIMLHEVEIACLPKHLPEYVELNITDLHAGQAIHISDLPEIEGVVYHGNPQTVVVAVAGGSAARKRWGAEGRASMDRVTANRACKHTLFNPRRGRDERINGPR